jgi:hypothetical protein
VTCQTTINQLTVALAPGTFSVTVNGIATSVSVMPGNPQTFAVAYYGGSTVQIFDGTVGRANTLSDIVSALWLSLDWISSDALFAVATSSLANNAPPDYTSCSYPVNPGGISSSTACWSGGGAPIAFHFANGLGYGQSGAVVNPQTGATVATLALPIKGSIEAVPLPDATLDRLFVIETTTTGTGCVLQTFTLKTLEPLASLDLPVDASGHCLDEGTGLVRYGSDGLAFNAVGAAAGGNSFIVTISGMLVSG